MSHLVSTQNEVVDINVLLLVRKGATPRNGDRSPSDGPIEHNLGARLTLGLADGCQTGITPDGLGAMVARSAHWDVPHRHDLIGQHELYQILLSVRWIQLDFIHHGPDAAVAKEICKHLQTEIADPKRLGEPLVDKCF